MSTLGGLITRCIGIHVIKAFPTSSMYPEINYNKLYTETLKYYNHYNNSRTLLDMRPMTVLK